MLIEPLIVLFDSSEQPAIYRHLSVASSAQRSCVGCVLALGDWVLLGRACRGVAFGTRCLGFVKTLPVAMSAQRIS